MHPPRGRRHLLQRVRQPRHVSRDFIYVDDVTGSVCRHHPNLTVSDFGESFNIGTGRKTTIGEVAAAARNLFGIAEEPSFTMPDRTWDVQNWYADIKKARCASAGNQGLTFADGLKRH